MATVTPTATMLMHQVAVSGEVQGLVFVQFPEPMILTGVPDWRLADGEGNEHKPHSAAPHVSDPTKYKDFVTAHFNSIPAFGPYELIVEPGDTHLTNVGGDQVTPDTYLLEDHR